MEGLSWTREGWQGAAYRAVCHSLPRLGSECERPVLPPLGISD